MLKKKKLRWLLYSVGIIAVVALTAITVFSLITLRENSITNQKQAQKLQVSAFAERVNNRLEKPIDKFYPVDIDKVQQAFKKSRSFPKEATKILMRIYRDSLYKEIFYLPAQSNACNRHQEIYRFNPQTKRFDTTLDYPQLVCDGMNLAQTRMEAIITTYRFSHNNFFDAERSLNIALIDQHKNHVVGYLSVPLNKEYLINHILQPMLENTFGEGSNTGLTVWLRDWTNAKVIAGSNPKMKFDWDKHRIEIIQSFHNIFENWHLYASISNTSLAATTKKVFWIALIILIAAVILLTGALSFIFMTIRREQELIQRQSDFLANVTHELKTPVSVMQAAGENLADGRVKNQSRLKNYGEHIFNEAIRLERMIDNLLNVAKADANELSVRKEPISLIDIVHTYLTENRTFITETKGFTLKTAIPEQLPKVMADKKSIVTIIENLTNNSLKYSNDQKFLGIYLFREKATIKLQIEDHGIGLTHSEQVYIFEKFYRVEDPMTAQTKGHGLGLSIVKNLVNLNDGTIQVESKKGFGSIFTVSFPIHQEKPNKQHNQELISSEI